MKILITGAAGAIGSTLIKGMKDRHSLRGLDQMIGGNIGNTLMQGFAYGKANMPTIVQQSGGTLMKALTMHMAAVLPTATAHSINLDDQ